MRRAAKVDANQPQIVKDLRKLGYSVDVNHNDILVGKNNFNFWYEIKNVDGRNRKQEGQEKLEQEWKGHYKIVNSLDEILADINIIEG